MNKKYSKLLEPLHIRNVALKNRIVKSAQWTIYANPDGSASERLVGWYESLARGGVGLITVEESICDYPLGASNMPHLRLDDDRFIPGLSQLASAIHKHNCPAFVQITHAGPAHNPQAGGGQPMAPSSLNPPLRPKCGVAKELTVIEIKGLIEKFARSALRVKKSGFDGVEIHMAHYALVNAFLSRIQNKRQDEYGGQSLKNRARFSVEILRRTRELVGPEFAVGVRMNGKEWGHELGTTNEEAIEFARMFEKAGADYLQVSAYGYGAFASCWYPNFVSYPETPKVAMEFVKRIPTGALVPEAATIRKAVSIPVSVVGYIDYKVAEQVLEKNKADLVCFGRHLMADPEFPKKLVEDKEDDIRPCVGCMNCVHLAHLNEPAQCRVNAFMGQERKMVQKPAEKKKKVMVIGAGPAGLEAARVAAERGHKVVVYDKEREIGGLLPMAAFIKGMQVENVPALLEFYDIQFKKLGIKVHLGKEVDIDLINRLRPDVVILAPGSKPVNPEIRVKDGGRFVTSHVLKDRAKTFLRLLGPQRLNRLTKIFLPLGKRVVVIGGNLQGLETADFLIKRGREVTIVEESAEIGEGMFVPWLEKLLPWMEEKNVRIFKGVKYEEVTGEGITITTKDGGRKTIEANTVIYIDKHTRNADLQQALGGKVPELYLIGDAKSEQLGYITGAIHDGALVGLTI